MKVAFNSVHAVERYGRSKEFGFLPTISAPGPNCELKSIGATEDQRSFFTWAAMHSSGDVHYGLK